MNKVDKNKNVKKIKDSLGSRIFDIVNIILMAVIAYACLAPVLHVIFASLSDPVRLLSHRGILLKPLGFSLEGYKIIFDNDTILVGYLNTIFYVVFGVLVSIILTVMGAYALSRRNLLWGNAIMFFVTFTMFFNGGLIPFYIVVTKLGMFDSRLALILPSAVSAFNLIIMRTSLREIPDSLEESALIDGAGHLTIMWKIILPLAKATIAVIVLFYAVAMWNSWFPASIFIRDRSKYPLQLILKEIFVQNDTSHVSQSSSDTTGINTDVFKMLVKYCTIVAATLPVLFFYPFFQKYFVKGVMIGSIKG
ncbi:MAG: carbohydrate ABC transporter permease [Clostridiales bacterium]|jgi:putative aldouronate transport system permease protein|nr:carbohydrate ABC transporter permease [Clostridiales bacterium]